MDNTPFNVLSNDNWNNQDHIDRLAAIINNSGCNRYQRRRLEKAAGKLTKKAENKIGRNLYDKYQAAADSNMRRFFSVLGIVLKDKYGFEESDDKEEISDMFDVLNKYLSEYQDLSTDEVAEICSEKTGLILIPDDH